MKSIEYSDAYKIFGGIEGIVYEARIESDTSCSIHRFLCPAVYAVASDSYVKLMPGKVVYEEEVKGKLNKVCLILRADKTMTFGNLCGREFSVSHGFPLIDGLREIIIPLREIEFMYESTKDR